VPFPPARGPELPDSGLVIDSLGALRPSTLPPPGPPAAPTGLVLDLHRPPGSGGSGLTPVLTLDGVAVAARWGRNVFCAPPGRHHVGVATAGYLWRYGATQQVIDVAPGHVVTLGYRSPLVTLARGRLGADERPGQADATVAGLLTLLGPALLVAVLVLVARLPLG